MSTNGVGLFETVRVIDSKPMLLPRHLHRMRRSARELGLSIPTTSELKEAIMEHLSEHPRAFARLRVTWQDETISIISSETERPSESVRLTISSSAVDRKPPLRGHKCTDYDLYSQALNEAVAAGYDDALLVNAYGKMCETSTANVFYVIDDMLYTPALTNGCLPGIMRELVMESVIVAETSEEPWILECASEVFITSALRHVQPVTEIDNYVFPIGDVTCWVAEEIST